ncbi:MAG: uracil phosphoribosyltransferase [Acidobacteriota bacterium]|nr:uracil phosphoribosyltransferase [Acidobacteriota bacterium]MDQ3170985.1 uracil phosphoribosyltransferase [Acidobacteriota bacterium]
MPVHLVSHPLAQDALGSLRDIGTQPGSFRRLAERLSLFLAAEALKDLPTEDVEVQTPLGAATVSRVKGDVVVVPVLRAGLGMLDAVLRLIPWARVGHIGLRRDETTAVASRYYTRLPKGLESSYVLLIDPMLATGGSAVDAIQVLEDAGARDIRILCIVAAPEGIRTVEAAYPRVRIYTPVIDRGLNEQKFIVPGLGDFGDRLYGTE